MTDVKQSLGDSVSEAEPSRDNDTGRHDRFEVDCNRVSASIQVKDGVWTSVRVEDISIGGLKLLSPTPLPTAACAKLLLEFRRQTVLTDVFVRWSQPLQTHQWRTGCEFDGPLDASVINSLNVAGVIQTDNQARQVTALPATVRHRLQADVRYPVEVINIAKGGVCLRSRIAFDPGQDLLLEVAEPHSTDSAPPVCLVLRIQWCRLPETGDEHLSGCRFSSTEGFATLRALADTTSDSEATNDDTEPPPRSGAWAGAALVLGWSVLFLSGNWPDLFIR